MNYSGQEPYIPFMGKRMAPCVLVFVSNEIRNAYPNYKELVKGPWEKVLEDTKTNYRLIYPDELPTIDQMKSLLLATKKPATPFPSESTKKHEFRATSLCRQLAFSSDYLPYHCSIDLPVGILALVSGNEAPQIPLNSFPKWARRQISKTKANSLRLPAADPVSALTKFVTVILNKRYQEWCDLVTRNYNTNWVVSRVSLMNIFDRGGVSSNLLDLKYYADLNLQRGNYKNAINLYNQAIENVSQSHAIFISEIYLMMAICDLLGNMMGPQTVQYLIMSSRLQNAPIHLIKCSLMEFYVRASIGTNPVSALHPLMAADSAPLLQLVRPFAMEQHAHLTNNRHAALTLAKCAKCYDVIGSRQDAARALVGAMTPFKAERWEFLLQTLCDSVSLLGGLGTEQLQTLASCRSVVRPQAMARVLRGGPFKAGFVEAHPSSFYSEGFMCTPPLEYSDDWEAAAERLFGAFRPGEFFSMRATEKREALVGELVDIRTLIKCASTEFSLQNLRLRTRGIEAESTQCTLARPSVADVNLGFVAKESGMLEILGVCFEWGNGTFEADFETPLTFEVHSTAPSVNVELLQKKAGMLEGEIAEFVFRVTNGPKDLTHMMLLTTGIEAKLVSPAVDEVVGQYVLGPMPAGASKELRISIITPRAGFFHAHVLLSYWNRNEGPARYHQTHLMLNVRPVEGATVTETETGFSIAAPAGTSPLGFTLPGTDLQPFTSLTEECAVLDMISQATKHVNKIPLFAEPFGPPPGLAAWFATQNGTVAVPLKARLPPVKVLITRTGTSRYTISVANSTKGLLKDIRVITIAEDDPSTAVITGKGIVIIDALPPSKTVEVPISIIRLEERAVISLLVSCDLFFVSHKVVIE